MFGRLTKNAKFVKYFEEVDGSEKKKRVGPPKEKERDKTQVFVDFLKRFHETTFQVGISKKTISTLILEEIVSMGTVIDKKILETIDPSLREVAERMKSKFMKYWGGLEKLNKFAFLGYILNPLYKLKMIVIHLGDMKLDATKNTIIVKILKNCLMEL